MGREKSETTSTIQSGLPIEQITKLRDAFEIIDHDNDGIISDKDLAQLEQTTGKKLTSNEVKSLLEESEGPMNFSAFMSLISDDLSQLPNKNEILRALKVFSQDTEINQKELQESLSAIGMEECQYQDVLKKFESERMNGDKVFMGTDFLNFVSN